MPKGSKESQEHISGILFNYHCYECDQHKKFQTEKMRDKFFLLHKKFCKCEVSKGGATTNFGGRKPVINIK